jgi:hypothetical protein
VLAPGSGHRPYIEGHVCGAIQYNKQTMEEVDLLGAEISQPLPPQQEEQVQIPGAEQVP